MIKAAAIRMAEVSCQMSPIGRQDHLATARRFYGSDAGLALAVPPHYL
jgi:hypothetical protein